MAWYDTNWTYRQKVTVDATKVGGADQTNMPVYVDLSGMSTGFFTHVLSGGGDIRVTKADGTTELAREVVNCDTSGSIGELHFLADTVSSTTNTDFYIYYGNAAASDYAATDTFGRNAVWAAYGVVLHMGTPSSLAVTDSTGTNSPTSTSVTAGTGKLGGAATYDGTNGHDISVPDNTSIALNGGVYTIQMWVHLPTTEPSFVGLFAKGTTSNDYALQRSSTTTTTQLRNNGTALSFTSTFNLIATAAWVQVTVTKSGSSNLLYINNSSTSVSSATNPTETAAVPLRIGSSRDPITVANGSLIDEFRLIKGTARSAASLTADYNNQSSPATFYTVAAEETNGGTSPTEDQLGGFLPMLGVGA